MVITTLYLFNGKEKQTTANINYMDYGARMYDDFTGRWFVQDPLQGKRVWISSYAFCSNNPIVRIDPDGMLDDLVITGNLADDALRELQRAFAQEISISMSAEGNVSYTQNNLDKPLSAEAQQLTNVINDPYVTVNIKAENTTQTTTGNLYIGGAFMGNTATTVFPGHEGSATLVNANQEINPTVLNAADAHTQTPGKMILHEVTEAYQGAKISQSTGNSVGHATQADAANRNSVFHQAHNKATPQTPVYQTIYDRSGNITTDATQATRVEWSVINNGKSKLIQTLQ